MGNEADAALPKGDEQAINDVEVPRLRSWLAAAMPEASMTAPTGMSL